MRFLAALPVLLLPLQALADPIVMQIELNRLVESENGCAATFVVENPGETVIETYLLEAVIFDTDDRVDRLTLFDFGTLPAGTRRVREFAVPSLECDRIGAVLINGIAECSPRSAVCDAPPRLSSRIDADLN